MTSETPFKIHLTHRDGSYKIRQATVAEALEAVRSTLESARWKGYGEWFFPFYKGQDIPDVERWLHENGFLGTSNEDGSHPSFEAIHGRKPVAGQDYDTDAPMEQDEYEFFTGTGDYR
jgi:hypothetical protein